MIGLHEILDAYDDLVAHALTSPISDLDRHFVMRLAESWRSSLAEKWQPLERSEPQAALAWYIKCIDKPLPDTVLQWVDAHPSGVQDLIEMWGDAE